MSRVVEARASESRPRRAGRAALLAAVTLALLTVGATVMVAVALVTLGRARRLYREGLARWLSRAILGLWGVRVDVERAEPFPATQAIYVSNHSSTLDMFVLVALGLPDARLVGAADVGGFLRWMVPLGPISAVMGTLWVPPPSRPAERARWFRRTERLLRQTGESLYLSPEGERVTSGQIGPFRPDTLGLAAALGVPIVAVYIGIPRAIDPGRGFDARPGTIRVRVEPAISPRGWTAATLETRTEEVRDLFVRLHRQRPE